MITVNEYFDGAVKSLGYQTANGKSTIGIIDPGKYEFGTSMYEILTIIEGELSVLLPGEELWKTYYAGQKFEVAANKKFKVSATVQTSYLCLYR